MECKCSKCQAACLSKPGWFIPGEAEKAADLLKMSLQEFFNTYLSVDWWAADDNLSKTTFILAPNILNNEPGTEYPFYPKGICVFFIFGLCTIHEAKPFECAEMNHDAHEAGRHLKVAKQWENHQDQIIHLLGRQPVIKCDSLSSLRLLLDAFTNFPTD